MPKCFNCSKECGGEMHCFGCSAYVCEECDVSDPCGSHAPEAHLEKSDGGDEW